MTDIDEEAAVRASLDDALGELLRTAVDNPTEPDAASYARIDHVLDLRMTPHRHLAWALVEAEALKRQLKSGLQGQALDTIGGAYSATHADGREPRL